MNGLLLPTGSKEPIRGDASLSTSPPKSDKLEQNTKVKSEPGSSLAHYPNNHVINGSRGPPRAIRSVSGPSSSSSGTGAAAASLAFIPRSSRNSAGIRKAIHHCSEFELEQMLDRNERILATLGNTSLPTRTRLLKETEDIRDAIRSIRAVRDVNSGISSVQLKDPSAQAELESALSGLSVQDLKHVTGSSPPTESFGWSRDTVAVKKKLAQDSSAYQPGRKVQAISYEQSLAIQTAALVAEMERERKAEDLRLKAAASRDKASAGVPSGAAHRLGRKSISSCSGSMRKHSAGSHSTSPPKVSRAAGPLATRTATASAQSMDLGPDHDAELEGGDSDQDNAADDFTELHDGPQDGEQQHDFGDERHCPPVNFDFEFDD